MPTGETKAKVEASFEVEGFQRDWLDKMTAEYKLPDQSKTLRCILAWAMEPSQPSSEGGGNVDKKTVDIFTVVRKTCDCDPKDGHKCGKK